MPAVPARYRPPDDVDPGEVFVDVDTRTHYELVRERGHGGAAHHRLLALAWGLIDSLDDAREVDHVVPLRWLNVEENLQAVDAADHGRVTRRREQARKARAAGTTRLDAYADGGGRRG